MRQFISLTVLFIMATVAKAGDIRLPEPDRKGGLPFNEAVASRHSVREFDASRMLPPQTLSDMLWAAAGVNRPDTGKRTNPTALNKQEIDLYVFTADGVYVYDFNANMLRSVKEGDHRSLVAGTKGFSQDFVLDAPVSVVMIADLSRFEAPAGDGRVRLMAACDAGIVSQNINLYCAAHGLATVPRATMDSEAILTLLDLPSTSLPLLNNPVGYPASH